MTNDWIAKCAKGGLLVWAFSFGLFIGALINNPLFWLPGKK